MSDPQNIILERLIRLTQAVADLTESHAAAGRMIARKLTQMDDRLTSIDQHLVSLAKETRELASEQILLGNRVENAFARALRANIRLDELEDRKE